MRIGNMQSEKVQEERDLCGFFASVRNKLTVGCLGGSAG